MELDELDIGIELEARTPDDKWIPSVIVEIIQPIIRVESTYPDGKVATVIRVLSELRSKKTE